MFEKCECGTIKWVPRVIREGKHFGFVRSPDGENIFFHFGGGMTFFSNNTWHRGIGRDPKPGDTIVFERGENYKGITASPWAYVADYEEARRVEVAPHNYRVMRVTIFASRENPFVTSAWEGVDLDTLAREHPHTGTLMDDFHCFKTPSFTSGYIFEVEVGPGQWKTIPDPRPLVQSATVHELVAVA